MAQLVIDVKTNVAFAAEARATPPTSLRSGNAIDDYGTPVPFDAVLDATSDLYLESFHWGLPHLDAISWRHYLPYLIDYA